MNKLFFIFGGMAVLIIAGGFYFKNYFPKETLNLKGSINITNFEECIEAGNPAMESFPRQCRTENGLHFVEDVVHKGDKKDVIRVTSPLANDEVGNPIVVRGEARGFWFFEGDFGIELLDAQGETIFTHFAIADGEWMTEEFVPFTATFPFYEGDLGDGGTLILHKANPSGLVVNEDSLSIPVTFTKIAQHVKEILCTSDSRIADACIQIYQPVCGKVNVQCITTPCDPILETFSNSCEACRNQLVKSYTEGACIDA